VHFALWIGRRLRQTNWAFARRTTVQGLQHAQKTVLRNRSRAPACPIKGRFIASSSSSHSTLDKFSFVTHRFALSSLFASAFEVVCGFAPQSQKTVQMGGGPDAVNEVSPGGCRQSRSSWPSQTFSFHSAITVSQHNDFKFVMDRLNSALERGLSGTQQCTVQEIVQDSELTVRLFRVALR
jgi:hypothetical protein